MAGGYGASSASPTKWLANTVWAPTTATTAETFLWYQANPRLALGLAHLWKQNALRFLASANLHPETASIPGVNFSIGVQGIGTGNPGYGLTLEKNFSQRLNAYAGIGLRSNEEHGHLLGGVKLNLGGPWTLGLQLDGHQEHPFATYSERGWIAGAYLIDLKSPALMLGHRF